MTERRLFVCEKPSQVKILMENPEITENDFIIIATAITSYLFDFDKKKEKTPVYKFNAKQYACPSYFYNKSEQKTLKSLKLLTKDKIENKKSERLTKKIRKLINKMDKIYYFNDIDHTGARAFDFRFNYFFEYEDFHKDKLIDKMYQMNTGGHSKENITNGIKNALPLKNNKVYLNNINSYKKKDYFEYNFNYYSNKYYTSYFKTKNININKTLTFNMISLLLLIKDGMVEHEIFDLLETRNIGSAASRSAIMDNVIKSDLIINDGKKIITSKEAKDFIKKYINKELYSNRNFYYVSNYEDEFCSFDFFVEKYDNFINKNFEKFKINI